MIDQSNDPSQPTAAASSPYGPPQPAPAASPAASAEQAQEAQAPLSAATSAPPAAPNPAAVTPAAPISSATASARNPLGTAALAVGVAILALQLVFQFLFVAIVTSAGYQVYSAVALAEGILTGLLAAAAIVLGVIALLRPTARRAAAIIGITIGGYALFNILLGLIQGALFQLL